MFDTSQAVTGNVDPGIDVGLDHGRAICFGSFRLVPAQRLLLEDNKPLHLGSRALDILIALVERPGELVSKEVLMARVWPSTFVEPANLTVHIAALRRILRDGHDGNRFLINIPGRGYRFVAPIRISEKTDLSPPVPVVAEHTHNLPANITHLVIDLVATLVAKSLLVADAGATESRFRMFKTIRADVLAKLAKSDELEAVRQRYEKYCGDDVQPVA